ncbi:MAG: glycosyltransferase family 4 protein [Planctomycetaceae bacterium]|jgi:glycosyltransferase involved in cell wall biosynthesis|nr:glycosyltransferase family 4 protein [Planctomycetaceae bacterium]
MTKLNKPRLWIVSELYYPEDTSTGYILTKIAEGLASKFSVFVLCCQPTYSQRGVKSPKKEIKNDVCIKRCFSTLFSKDSIIKRLINATSFCFSLFFTLLFCLKKNDKLLVVTNPPIVVFFTFSVCWLRRVPMILLVHDVYPDVLTTLKILSKQSIIVKVWRFLNQQILKRCSKVITIGRDMRQKLINEYGAPSNQSFVVPNFADLENITPQDRNRNPTLIDLGLQNHFVIQNAGNIGPTHDVNLIIHSAEKLAISNPEIVFLFIGSGRKKDYLDCKIKEMQIKNIISLPSQPRGKSCEFLNACDISLSVFIDGMNGVSVPSRSYNIMASGKPILAVTDFESELALMVQEERIGWVVAPNDVNGFVSTCLNIYNQRDILPEMGKRARIVAETKYSLDKIIQLFGDCLK